MAHRNPAYAESLAGEAVTWRQGTSLIKTGLRLWRSATRSRVGTLLRMFADAADRHGFVTIGIWANRAARRQYDICAAICAEGART